MDSPWKERLRAKGCSGELATRRKSSIILVHPWKRQGNWLRGKLAQSRPHFLLTENPQSTVYQHLLRSRTWQKDWVELLFYKSTFFTSTLSSKSEQYFQSPKNASNQTWICIFQKSKFLVRYLPFPAQLNREKRRSLYT